ncbi:MAG: glycoside hydrolase [Alphaproteobacteria bacterium]|nr:glycoside hydrolase [Alphaproteobacteria bacterium]
MPSHRVNRRDFFQLAGTTGLVAAALPSSRGCASPRSKKHDTAPAPLPENGMAIPDQGWRLWIDEKARWQDDTIHLPEDVDLKSLPNNAPSGGWEVLTSGVGISVTLPSTVEQHHWGHFGSRSYTSDEYAWAAKDPVPQNGAYRGVSWWWREIDIPASFEGRRIILNIRGARMRAEVYLNQKLVGYSIMEELPFDCDLTQAANTGGKNLLAVRITNPGGRYDWVDGATIEWGKVKFQRSHGFGGIDRGLTLSAHPIGMRIGDLWVLNAPKRQSVHAFVKLTDNASFAHSMPGAEHLVLEVIDEGTGRTLPARITFVGHVSEGVYKFVVTAKNAKLWTLTRPSLYRLRARWKSGDGAISTKAVRFGFRWFGPDGLGKDAVFRLNGQRIKLYSAISWGFWGLNGLWPTPDLAEKEVVQAKTLGLNCLNFHRNVGKIDVFEAHDRLGLLRYMEPGGGKFAIGKLPKGVKADANSVVMEPPHGEAELFSQRFMIAKCVAMVRTFRSHPSLIQYTLQNEIGADLNDPATIAILDAMRAEDESRSIVLNDGFVSPPRLAAQAWYAPYDPKIHRSDEESWGDWWNDHQGAGDQWNDSFYKDPRHFNYRQPLRSDIVEFGEMEGCAVPDNHTLMVAEIMQRGGSSYDLDDHRQIIAAYNDFLSRWDFRKAFPTAESLFLAIGKRSYDSWQQYMENARINDATDFAVISGWESTAIENHSGIVDNLRNFKSDPATIRSSLLPVRPVAKQRSLVVAAGEKAIFDLYMLNDTGVPATGTLTLAMTDPKGHSKTLAEFAAPTPGRDQFSALIKEAFVTPSLEIEGMYRFAFTHSGAPQATQFRDILVVDTRLQPVPGHLLRIGVADVWDTLRGQLSEIPGILVENFSAGTDYSAIVASGLTEQSTPAQKLGGDEGLQLQRAMKSEPVSGGLPGDMLAAVKAGTPLLVVAQEDGLADGVATQLAAEGAFSYAGQVGDFRAPWMGNWYFLRAHPVYEGLPVDQAMGVHYQVHGRQANGLLVDGPNVDVFVGYSRDHDRRVGAGTFTTKLGATKILFQRVPDLNGPMQQRFLRNALSWLCG